MRLVFFICLLFSLIDIANAKQDFADFRNAGLVYARCDGAINIFHEVDTSAKNKRLTESACKKFKLGLSEVTNKIPFEAAKRPEEIKFFILLGENSPSTGLRSGMRFVRKGEPNASNGYDQAWENGIVVYSAANLMYLPELWVKKAIMHEMAHAWHILNWPEKYPPIYSAWKNAQSKGLYRNVKDTKGTTQVKAYALSNQLEYFAEVSAAYFVGINYYPFVKETLITYDPVGYRMVESLWSTR